jgi:Integrase core domain
VQSCREPSRRHRHDRDARGTRRATRRVRESGDAGEVQTGTTDDARQRGPRPRPQTENGEDRHPYELFLQLEDIEHKRTRVNRPQSNGIVERWHRTLLDEHFSRRGPPHWFETLDEMRTVLDQATASRPRVRCQAVATAVLAENHVAASVVHHKVVACRGAPVKTLNAAACGHGRLRDNVIAN